MLPPYAHPDGPELQLPDLLTAYVAGAGDGYSTEAHIEGPQLLAHRMIPLAVRIGTRAFLVRSDPPHDALEIKTRIELHLTSSDLRNVEPRAALGDIAAIQISAVRGAEWDLWGDEPAAAHRKLEEAVAGDDHLASMTSGAGADEGVGMSLQELLDDIDKKS